MAHLIDKYIKISELSSLLSIGVICILLNVPKSIDLMPWLDVDFKTQLLALVLVTFVAVYKGGVVVKPLFLIIIVFLIGFVGIRLVGGPLTITNEALFSFSFFALMVLFSSNCTSLKLSTLQVYVLFLGVVLPATAYYYYLGGSYGETHYTLSATRLAAPFGGSTVVAFVQATFFLVLLLSLLNGKGNHYINLTLILLCLALTFFTGSRGGFILIVLFSTVIYVKKLGTFQIMISSLVLVGLLLVIFASGITDDTSIRVLEFGNRSDDARWYKYMNSLRLFNERPIGTGLCSSTTWLFNSPQDKFGNYFGFGDPHNLMLVIIMELGVTGVVLVTLSFLTFGFFLIQMSFLQFSRYLPLFLVYTYSWLGSDLIKNATVMLLIGMLISYTMNFKPKEAIDTA